MNGSIVQAMLGCVLLLGLAAPGRAATVEYIHTDALGSPVAVTNSAGVVIERREYEPYGRQLVPATVADGPGYTGHVSDAATGLDYMQQRYYDSEIGRFLSVDPVAAYSNPVGMFNRYKYAANNPYRFTDPDGRMDKETRKELAADRRSIAARSPGAAAAMATSARGSFTKANASQRLEGANREVNRHKERMESIPNATLEDATRTFESFMQPIASEYGVEIESLVDGKQMPPYYLEATEVGNQFDRTTWIGSRMDRPTYGLTTIHAHPIVGGQWEFAPFSPGDIGFYGRMPNLPHFVTDPTGAYRFDGQVERISP